MRTYVVSGSASGIGAATVERLEASGHRVIGVDLTGATVEADLSTDAGRAAMVEGVRAASSGQVDAIVACAGISAESPQTISVNYFGAVATLEGLRPFLAGSDAPRAVVISSVASIMGADEGVVDACLADDEATARERMAENPSMAYLTSKTAIARWIRRNAPTAAWAGAGIPLNAIAPGTVHTPMTAELLAADGGLEMVDSAVPMPLNGHAGPEQIAPLLEFLASADNTHVTGQVVFVDGGADAVLRGDATW
ncbi:SDR family oxidoreductase [Actinospongicola halichondriae]|uniref:SDR family oxidoreductase n=1 Tax=Actinospongicola halichondriae TaxID=3236844 RepID=UPI003D55F001